MSNLYTDFSVYDIHKTLAANFLANGSEEDIPTVNRWAGSIAAWAAVTGAKTIRWYFTPTECQYDNEKDDFQEFLAYRTPNIMPHPIHNSMYGHEDGYTCVAIYDFVWDDVRVQMVSLGDGSPMASALSDYFVKVA